MMEYIAAGMVLSFFMVTLVGSYLVYRDKQTEWERRNKK
jgi:hypothetical protein